MIYRLRIEIGGKRVETRETDATTPQEASKKARELQLQLREMGGPKSVVVPYQPNP